MMYAIVKLILYAFEMSLLLQSGVANRALGIDCSLLRLWQVSQGCCTVLG